MSETFLSYVYGTILNPIQTFENILKIEKAPVFQALWAVVLVSVMGCFYSFDINNLTVLAFSLISYIIFALISWILVASIIDILAGLFRKENKFETILTLTGFSLLPWMFFGPATLIKGAGLLGGVISIPLCFSIWIWTTLLFLLSISKAYELSLGKTFALAMMPFCGAVIVLFWIVGFVSNIISVVAV